jgi:DNA-directed RNA polymerase specialized sigma subunit
MTAKEYLGQAYRLDQRINSKLEQVMSLRDLATKATSTLSDVAPSGTRNVHRMEDIIVKIVDLENEINHDIDNLVDLKREMVSVIKAVTDPEYQTILELRYLCFKSWEQIAVDMNYSIQHIYRLRDRALNEITPPASR